MPSLKKFTNSQIFPSHFDIFYLIFFDISNLKIYFGRILTQFLFQNNNHCHPEINCKTAVHFWQSNNFLHFTVFVLNSIVQKWKFSFFLSLKIKNPKKKFYKSNYDNLGCYINECHLLFLGDKWVKCFKNL